MTISEWIDRRDRPVPPAFRVLLDAEGPASVDSLLAAAEEEMRAYHATDSAGRRAGFTLLAADAYLTYACLRAVRESGGDALAGIIERIAREWTPGKMG